MIISLVLFALAVAALVILLPRSAQSVSWDESSHIIKIYREQLGIINHQHEKGLLSDDEKILLLEQAERKSAQLMIKARQKPFAYRHSWVLGLVLALGFALSGTFYGYFYFQQKVDRYQSHGRDFSTQITEGLFDYKVMEQNLNSADQAHQQSYCFLLQQQLLKHYRFNEGAVINLAQCFFQVGLVKQMKQALDYALSLNPKNPQAHYLAAEIEFLQFQALQGQTERSLLAIFLENPHMVKIGYLLMLDYFAKDRLDKVEQIAKELAPYSDNDPVLSEAIEALFKSRGILPQASLPAQQAVNTEEKNVAVESARGFSAVVVISPKLQQIAQGNKLFVIVKSSSGQLLSAAQFMITDATKPLKVRVEDGQAGIMQLGSMQGHSRVFVTARISLTGDSLAQSGDLTSPSTIIFLGDGRVPEILIDERVP